MRLVFIDRDGVINRNRDDHVKNTDEFEILPGSMQALCRLSTAGLPVVVVSNQACVGRGLVTVDALQQIDSLMCSKIRAAGGNINGTYYCLHRPDEDCDCRKPKPGLLFQASKDLGVDPKDAVFIGDAATDVQAGKAAGCKTVMVLTGRTSAAEAKELDPVPDFVARNLDEAIDWILTG